MAITMSNAQYISKVPAQQHLLVTVANPAISGGDNTGDCQTDTSLHLSCVIPPATGPFLCSRLS